MGSFDNYSNYDATGNPQSVVFGSNKPILETELNELQQIQDSRLTQALREYVGTMYPLNALTIKAKGNSEGVTEDYVFNLQAPLNVIVSLGGIIYTITISSTLNNTFDNLGIKSLADARKCQLLLTYRTRFITSSDDLYAQGFRGLYGSDGELKVGGTKITNSIKDKRIGVETTRRVVLEYILVIGNCVDFVTSSLYASFVDTPNTISTGVSELGDVRKSTADTTKDTYFFEANFPWLRPNGIEEVIEAPSYGGIGRIKYTKDNLWSKKTVILKKVDFKYYAGSEVVSAICSASISLKDLGIDANDVVLCDFTYKVGSNYISSYAPLHVKKSKPLVDFVDISPDMPEDLADAQNMVRFLAYNKGDGSVYAHDFSVMMVLTLAYKNNN